MVCKPFAAKGLVAKTNEKICTGHEYDAVQLLEMNSSKLIVVSPLLCYIQSPNVSKIRTVILLVIYVKKLQFIHKLTARDTSKTAKITKR